MNGNDIDDPLIGNLPWHAQHECWGGFIDVTGHTIPLTVMPSEQSEPPLGFIRSLVDVLRKDEKRFRRSAAEELLDVYNEDWRVYTGDELEMSVDTFVAQLSLKTLLFEFITLDATRDLAWGAVLTYDASGMFTEHDVAVTIRDDLSVAGVGLD